MKVLIHVGCEFCRKEVSFVLGGGGGEHRKRAENGRVLGEFQGHVKCPMWHKSWRWL